MRVLTVLLVAGGVFGGSVALGQPAVRRQPELRVTVDGGVTVHFAGMRGVSGDWIAIARAGSAPTEYAAYQYPGEQARGTLTFAEPGEGDWVVRAFFGSSSYVVRAESAPFRIVDRCRGEQTITASADGTTVFVRFTSPCASPTDWIALAPVGSTPQTYTSWQYTNGAREAVVPITGLPPGQWVARLFTNWSGTRSYEVRAQSAPFWLAPPGCVCGDVTTAR
jgi:hypothetical protein